MAKQIIEARVKQKVDTESNWLTNELRLLDGEQAFVRTDAGVSVNFKIGDGNKTFSELPYFYPPLTLGSISTTQTLSQLNALADGVWVAMTAGRYANGLTSKEGFFTTFRKDGNQWTINSETEVSFSGQDIDWIEAQLADHNQRITDNRSNIEYLTDYTWGKAQALSVLSSRVDNLTESNIKIIGLYPTLDNPTSQSSFNRRLFNMVQNGLDNQSNFRTNTTNNVTSDFKIVASNWEMKQTNLGLVVTSRGNEMTYENGFSWLSQDDEKAYINKDRIGGNTLGVDWSIRKVTGTTLPSNYILPANAQTRTLPISVNGNFADANGNIVVSGGSGGSYILPPATVSTLGGIKIGSGLTASEDGTVSVSGGGASYIAGLGITIDRNEISAKVDGTTITTNASGQLVAVGGGGSEYVLPTATNTVKGGVRVDNKTTRMNGELIESLLPKRETIRIALSAFNTDLMTGDLNGFVAVRPFKIVDFKTTVGVVPSGSAITTGIKKNNSVITNTLSIINANTYTSVATAQPTFSSDAFAINDRLNFYIPTGGIGTTSTGQNLQAVLIIEYTD